MFGEKHKRKIQIAGMVLAILMIASMLLFTAAAFL